MVADASSLLLVRSTGSSIDAGKEIADSLAYSMQSKAFLTSLVILGALFFVYVGWHVWLRAGKRVDVSRAVFAVAMSIFMSLFPQFIELIIFESDLLQEQLSNAQIVMTVLSVTCALVWCWALFLLCRGWDILGPHLSDEGWLHLKQLFFGMAVVLGLCVLAILPFPSVVAFAIGIIFAIFTLAFVAFYMVRFVQGIAATRTAVATLIRISSEDRRRAFDARFRRLLYLSLIMVAISVIVNAIVIGFSLSNDQDTALARASLKVVTAVMSVVFVACLAIFFYATPNESLKLWSSNNNINENPVDALPILEDL